MTVKCITCDLVFRTSNELDWHVREEHLRPSLPATTPPAKATGSSADPSRSHAPPAPGAAGTAAAGTATAGLLTRLRDRLGLSGRRQPPR